VEEIRANASEGCMSLSPQYLAGLNSSLLHWGRFNTLAAGSPGTIGGSSTENQYRAVYPTHTLTTSYAYQSLNKVNAQQTPDGGESHFWYDMLGRSVLSQNAEQLDPVGGGYSNRFGFQRYDALGRTIENGEKYFATFDDPSSVFVNNSVLNTFYAGSWNSDLTRTYYDVSVSGTNAVILSGQNNLRKRISAVRYERNGGNAHTTYYSYDAIGNVNTVWHATSILGIKRVDYKYDLISGNLMAVRYQRGWPDQFYYGYEYDAENRLTKAFTSLSSSSADGWTIANPHIDATYRYYPHGLLARIELGNEQLVQGIDYAYTLQGWLKGVNGNYLLAGKEIGGDGIKGGPRANVNRDAYAYSLDYFKGDYRAIGTNADAFKLSWSPGNAGEIGSDLYNGNISRSTVALKRINEQIPVGYNYRYDQLNRLKETRQQELAIGATGWNATTAIEAFKESLSYDGNGNILSYIRNGSKEHGVVMDQLNYLYKRDASGNLLNNTLSQVTDAVDNPNYTEDIKNQQIGNYKYDNIGNLLSDEQEGISKIEWNSYGKILEITKSAESSLSFQYDATGNRWVKSFVKDGIEELNYYVYDLQGNILAVYGNKNGDNNLYWKQQHLYGRNRLGVWNIDAPLSTTEIYDRWLQKGNKQYELTNHLGNVLVTISDKSVDSVIGNVVDHYEAEILSSQDYYPFGMLQPDRQWRLGNYCYGFNGKQNDDEISGRGKNIAYENRIYDARLGRWLSVDPLQMKYPESSPYSFSLNSPLYLKDIDGRDVGVIISGNTITFHNTFYISQATDPATMATTMACVQQLYDNNYKGKLGGTYTADGKTYNVKFEFSFKVATAQDVARIKGSQVPIAESIVNVKNDPKNTYSNAVVGGNEINMSSAVIRDITFMLHEGSHNLGFVDRYDNISFVGENGFKPSLSGFLEKLDGASITKPGFEGDPLGGNFKLNADGLLVPDKPVKYSQSVIDILASKALQYSKEHGNAKKFVLEGPLEKQKGFNENRSLPVKAASLLIAN
jgi:RHS repeat-associated protein